MIRRSRRAWAPVLLTLAGLTGTASAQQWQVTPIADNRGQFAEFSLPVINAGGQVAFTATYDDINAGAVVYRLTGKQLVSIADTTGSLLGFLGDPSINTAGAVAFAASLDAGGDAVLVADGTAVKTIAGTVADSLISISAAPFINDPGTVVFKAVRTGGGSDADAILKGSGGPLTTVLDESGPYNGFGDTPSISNDGTIAFFASVDAGGFGVFTTTNGTAVTTAASSGAYTSLENLGINNNDEVLMRGVSGLTVASLFQKGPSASATFVDTSGIFSQVGPAWVSDSGTVAFKGTLGLSGLVAIFAGGTLAYERAVAVGDPLSGSTITQLQIGRQAVNSSGKFVFWARLEDGTEGVYLAVPTNGDGGGGGGALDGLTVGLLAILAGFRRRRTGTDRRQDQ